MCAYHCCVLLLRRADRTVASEIAARARGLRAFIALCDVCLRRRVFGVVPVVSTGSYITYYISECENTTRIIVFGL